MHQEAFTYVYGVAQRLNPRQHVVEFGGRNLNGSVRPFFTTVNYVSTDLYEGPGVDWVGNATDYTPDGPVDTVISCEVFEHASDWPQLCQHAYDILERHGMFIITCATEPRQPHSTLDGVTLASDTTEYYANVDPSRLGKVLQDIGFSGYNLEINEEHGDLYCLAEK